MATAIAILLIVALAGFVAYKVTRKEPASDTAPTEVPSEAHPV
mgnify:CR=1 FL=1